jgi:hypothetical protein
MGIPDRMIRPSDISIRNHEELSGRREFDHFLERSTAADELSPRRFRPTLLIRLAGYNGRSCLNPEFISRETTRAQSFGGRMKGCSWLVARFSSAIFAMICVALIPAPAAAQTTSSLASPQSDNSQGGWNEGDPGGRFFFPRDTFWGWAQFDLAPPHNEVDPNQCAGNAEQYGGASAPCNLFARYMLSGILEVRPFGRTFLRRFMVFGAPTFLFGKNVPQALYTWSPDAIGIEHSWGAGIYINKGFEFRVTQHFLFDRIGARNKNLGLADLGSNGPWGRYMTVGVRKTIGTRRW